MKNIKEYILETKKDNFTCVVLDTENAFICAKFPKMEMAQYYADDMDKRSQASKKIIKSAKNLRFIPIDLNNLTSEAKEAMEKYPDAFKNKN